MTQEALRMALEVLERSDCLGYQANLKAITAIKEALAQPDTDMSYTIALQRAIEWHCDGKTVPLSVAQSCPYHAEKLNQALAQPEQAPVALQYPQKDIDWQREQQIKAQASTPPQRTEQEYESVLIDGVAYTIPSKVAVEILGLHLDLLQLKQEQEPVAHWSDCAVHSEPAYPKGECDCGGFATPPQRTWVDLTRTQIQDVYFAVLEEHRGGHQMEGQLAFGEALQAKLKERNT